MTHTISSYDQEKIDSLYPGATMVKPMRMWSLPKNKKGELSTCCNSNLYFGQIKKDGFFYSFNKTKDRSYLFSRNESVETKLLSEKIANVPHIEAALMKLPEDTVLIGEIYVPGGTSKDTTRIMGSLPQKAIERQEKEGLIHYYIHDIIQLKGKSLISTPAIDRYKILVSLARNMKLEKFPFIEIADIYEHNLQEEIANSLLRGEEGMVLKLKTAPYYPGKKPAWSAIKCKKEDFADVVCIGFEDATKDYSGSEIETWEYWIDDESGQKVRGYYYNQEGYSPITKPYFKDWKTAIVLGAYNENQELVEIGTVSSGMTDEIREIVSRTPDNFIGTVLMVECMEKDKEAKTFRHPIFRGFRIDKDAAECTIEDVFAD